MNREIRRLLAQFADGVLMLVLAIIIVQAHNDGSSIIGILLDAICAAILAFWLEQIWWLWRRCRDDV